MQLRAAVLSSYVPAEQLAHEIEATEAAYFPVVQSEQLEAPVFG